MATITPGYAFSTTETVTATKLASLATGTVTNIVNADVAAGAAIAYSKLTLTGSVTGTDIANTTIVSANFAASALPSAAYKKFTIPHDSMASAAENSIFYFNASGILQTLSASAAGLFPVSQGAGSGFQFENISDAASTNSSAAITVGITTATAMDSCSAVLTVNGRQSVLLTLNLVETYAGAGQLIYYQFYRDSTALGQEINDRGASAGDPYPFSMTYIDAKPAASAYNYHVKWRIGTSTATADQRNFGAMAFPDL